MMIKAFGAQYETVVPVDEKTRITSVFFPNNHDVADADIAMKNAGFVERHLCS